MKKALVEIICIPKHTKSNVTVLYPIKTEDSSDSFVDMMKPLLAIDEEGNETKKLYEANQIMK
ncbi:MAG: hypothetical protein GWN01_08225 [Nitrosopumilaceae archaeon]|nr:hypothetical protein [Nitrosopumilaceae archaeon]NIU00905.1 hypothetical protein [Nitrosopumilaceae archaeon]NIU87358.1 hypothetical protein [Nitrosopumilaceae archaeon]NIV65886.1 hypothetical protein [Nitrosopumilaceae archaeon]NIX61507.1 hypothetical protein [Nitrosopumilaceae archaeon]